MSRKPSRRPTGRPKTRNHPGNVETRRRLAIAYALLRNSSQSAGDATFALGLPESTRKKWCAEFSDDPAIKIVRGQQVTLQQKIDELKVMALRGTVLGSGQYLADIAYFKSLVPKRRRL